jgi:hypothetical protein
LGESTARFCACRGAPCNAPTGLNETINLYDRATTYRVVPDGTCRYPFWLVRTLPVVERSTFDPSVTVRLGPFWSATGPIHANFGHRPSIGKRQLRMRPIPIRQPRPRWGTLSSPQLHRSALGTAVPPYGQEASFAARTTEYVVSVIGAAGGIGSVGLMLRPFTRTLCHKWLERSRRKSYLKEEEARRKTRVAEIEAAGKADVARIRETGKILRALAELEPDQAGRLQGRLERVRPPPEPDELKPPAAS